MALCHAGPGHRASHTGGHSASDSDGHSSSFGTGAGSSVSHRGSPIRAGSRRPAVGPAGLAGLWSRVAAADSRSPAQAASAHRRTQAPAHSGCCSGRGSSLGRRQFFIVITNLHPTSAPTPARQPCEILSGMTLANSAAMDSGRRQTTLRLQNPKPTTVGGPSLRRALQNAVVDCARAGFRAP